MLGFSRTKWQQVFEEKIAQVFYVLLEYKNKVDQINSVLLDLAPSSFGLLKILGAQRATIF